MAETGSPVGSSDKTQQMNPNSDFAAFVSAHPDPPPPRMLISDPAELLSVLGLGVA